MSRQGVLVSVGATAVAAVVATTALFVIDGDEPELVGQGLEHVGMVSGTVWVASKEGASLTAIDAGPFKVVTTLNGLESPHNVQVSPDGRTLWAVSGSTSLAVMVDSRTLGVHGTVPTGGVPAM